MTNIMDSRLSHYAQLWNLRDIQPLTQSERATVYTAQHKQHKVVLKLYRGAGVEEEISGAVWLQLCQGRAVVEVLQDDQDACLLEYCDGADLASLVRQGKDEQATTIAIDVMKNLHGVNLPRQYRLLSLQEYLSDLFKYAEQTTDVNFRLATKLAKDSIAQTRHCVVLHGDLHHYNILHHSSNGWLAIDGKGVIGDPAFDSGNLFLNPWHMPEIVHSEQRFLARVNLVSELMGIERQRILDHAFVRVCLASAWLAMDNQQSSHLQTMLKIIRQFVH